MKHSDGSESVDGIFLPVKNVKPIDPLNVLGVLESPGDSDRGWGGPFDRQDENSVAQGILL